ncbi:MAG: ATP synthase F1 subunit gamma [Bacteroidia bacterium]|nr:ATP synthase F1 subunit gamma [Bacteroidia bacterium]
MAANLKEVRERIKSVQSTQQITKAMKMVSASKLRRAQQAIVQIRPYTDRLNKMLKNIMSNIDANEIDVDFGLERPLERATLVVITSNRGLCGAFNSNVIKEGVNALQGSLSSVYKQGNVDIICIGKKGFEYFKKRYDKKANIIDDYVMLFDDLSFDNVSKVADRLMEAFSTGYTDRVEVAYGKFKNAAVQYPMCEQYLPVPKIEVPSEEEKASNTKADYIFEPEQNDLLNHLIPSILQTQFQRYNLDSHASEHGARMTAMDSATENAEEMIKDLRINYNKARQAAITKQISEIVGGAAAMESD